MCFNQLLRDGSMPILSGSVDRCGTILLLHINNTACFNQLLSDGSMSIVCSVEEWRGPTRVLGVDEVQPASRRQQRPDSHCIASTHSIVKDEHFQEGFYSFQRRGRGDELFEVPEDRNHLVTRCTTYATLEQETVLNANAVPRQA